MLRMDVCCTVIVCFLPSADVASILLSDLLAQFISRKTNLRADAYSPPLALLHTVVCAIRAAVPKSFILGIKLNVADYTSGGLSEKDGQQHLVDIASWDSEGASVDYIEISGGDYESPGRLLCLGTFVVFASLKLVFTISRFYERQFSSPDLF